MNTAMTEQEFETLIAAYGSNAARWPDGLKARANAYIDKNPTQANALLSIEHALDTALNALQKPALTPHLLMARIQNKAAQTAQLPPPANDTHRYGHKDQTGQSGQIDHEPILAPLSRLPAIAAMLIMAISLGFGTGQWMNNNNYDAAEALLAMSLDSQYMGSDFYEDTQ